MKLPFLNPFKNIKTYLAFDGQVISILKTTIENGHQKIIDGRSFEFLLGQSQSLIELKRQVKELGDVGELYCSYYNTLTQLNRVQLEDETPTLFKNALNQYILSKHPQNQYIEELIVDSKKIGKMTPQDSLNTYLVASLPKEILNHFSHKLLMVGLKPLKITPLVTSLGVSNESEAQALQQDSKIILFHMQVAPGKYLIIAQQNNTYILHRSFKIYGSYLKESLSFLKEKKEVIRFIDALNSRYKYYSEMDLFSFQNWSGHDEALKELEYRKVKYINYKAHEATANDYGIDSDHIHLAYSLSLRDTESQLNLLPDPNFIYQYRFLIQSGLITIIVLLISLWSLFFFQKETLQEEIKSSYLKISKGNELLHTKNKIQSFRSQSHSFKELFEELYREYPLHSFSPLAALLNSFSPSVDLDNISIHPNENKKWEAFIEGSLFHQSTQLAQEELKNHMELIKQSSFFNEPKLLPYQIQPVSKIPDFLNPEKNYVRLHFKIRVEIYPYSPQEIVLEVKE